VSEVDWQMAPDEVAPKCERVGEVAVVGEREAAGVQIGKQRLDVAQDGVAGGGVAVVAERDVALEPADHLGLVEVVADEAQAALGMEVAAVVGDDARGLLAAMLQGVQAERGKGGGILVAEHAEDAAFLAQRVVATGPPAELCRGVSLAAGSSHDGLSIRHDTPMAAATQAGGGVGRAGYRTTCLP
jgi:hypothetical protein